MPYLHRILRSVPLILIALLLSSCASTAPTSTSTSPAPGTLAYDKSVFGNLLDHHDAIRRSVRQIDDGIEATTESDDPAVAALLADHVAAMKRRIEHGGRVRQWDPLYIAMFDHADAIHLDIQPTPKGVRVRETSTDPRVVALIHAHAKVVSGFAAYGTEESAKAHPVPDEAK